MSNPHLVSSNAGYSGTPLWKLKQQGAVPNITKQQEMQPKPEEELETVPLPVMVDAVSLGRTEDTREKPLVRHVIVKDLRKVAARSKISLPTGGLFENRAAISLYALFDGQSCADMIGPLSAEWCAKQLLTKLLRNLSVLPAGYENETFVRAALKKAFMDLDKEILQTQFEINDGCGAAIALTVGEWLFTAVLGKCDAVIVESNNSVHSLGCNQGRPHLPDEMKFARDNGGMVNQGPNGQVQICSPAGGVSSVSRSLGDRSWKGTQGGLVGAPKLLRCIPEMRSMEISWAERHQYFMLTSAPVSDSVSAKDAAAIATEFSGRPRAASGDIAARAVEVIQNADAQCTVVLVYFVPKDKKKPGEPPAKKLKKDSESMRFRHILVKHRDCGQPFDPVRGRQVIRARSEAESMLRGALKELNAEVKKMKLPNDATKAQKAALQPSPKYLTLCKELSECSTAQKGGGMCGDLGWIDNEQLKQYGPSFTEIAKATPVGHWSDLASSDHGIHLLQKIA